MISTLFDVMYFIPGRIHMFIVVWNLLIFGLMINCFGPVRVIRLVRGQGHKI